MNGFKTVIAKAFLPVGISLLLVGCMKEQALLKTEEPVVIKPKSKIVYDYRIQPQDRVDIKVYEYPSLTPIQMSKNGFLVTSEGYLNLPLIHKVHIAGLTESQAANLLERRFNKVLNQATVNLEVLNKHAYILGEVKKPGPVPIERGRSSIFAALAVGGGLTDDAMRSNVLVLTHNRKGEVELRRIDLSSYQALAMSDLIVKPDDVIYVPPTSWKEFKISSGNFTLVLQRIAQVASPFVMMKNLSED